MPEIQIERDQLKNVRPTAILKRRGCVDKAGKPLLDLGENLTTAACVIFEDAEVSPQELLTVYEAIKQCLKIADAADARKRLEAAVDEAFEVTASLLQKQINRAIVEWVREWFPFVNSDACITTFMNHMSSLVQQYTIIVSLKYEV